MSNLKQSKVQRQKINEFLTKKEL